MTTIECPICDGLVPLETIGERITCDDCGVTADVAPDPVIELAAAA